MGENGINGDKKYFVPLIAVYVPENEMEAFM